MLNDSAIARRSLNIRRIEPFLGSLESSSNVDNFQKKNDSNRCSIKDFTEILYINAMWIVNYVIYKYR